MGRVSGLSDGTGFIDSPSGIFTMVYFCCEFSPKYLDNGASTSTNSHSCKLRDLSLSIRMTVVGFRCVSISAMYNVRWSGSTPFRATGSCSLIALFKSATSSAGSIVTVMILSPPIRKQLRLYNV